MQFTIPLQPISKKNSQQIFPLFTKVFTGWTYKGRNVRPSIHPSKAFKHYERAAMPYLPQTQKITHAVNVKCLFYMQTRRKCDLTNLLEAIDDIMVHAGLLEDDNFTIIQSHDGSRVLYDKENPRTEVYIEAIKDV